MSDFRCALIVWLVATLTAANLCGCGGAGPQVKSLTDPDPASKIPAIKQSVREKDQSSAGQLVKDLESDDSAVRFYAIEGLRRLTGETYGYRYYDSDDQRKPAVEQWHQWLKTKNAAAQP